MAMRKIKDDLGLQQAVAKAGSAQILARLVGVSPAAISLWKKVPVNRVPDVERLTGVPRHILRPDFWSPPETNGEAAA
jgi:DNA-binding transcriptional regulator YdaS (Cro superfamily)